MNRFAILLALVVCPLLAHPLFAITRTWNGVSSANWSDAANWSPAGVPQPEDALYFPAGGANRAMTNDLPPGTSVGPMEFHAIYTLSGNLLTLTGDVSALESVADLKLGASVALTGGSRILGALDMNGQTLTLVGGILGPLNGAGTIILPTDFAFFDGNGDFSGTIHGGPSGGSLALGGLCLLPNATVEIESILLRGFDMTLGDVTILPSLGGISPGDNAGIAPVLHTKSLSLSPPVSQFDAGLIVTVAPGGCSQIDVTGTVTLNDARLEIDRFNTVVGGPAIGQRFTIINNDGTDPVIGTFNGLPEGAIVASGLDTYRISYLGGDGNDVVLTTLTAGINTDITISQSASVTQVGQLFTVTATVAAQSGTPTGSVVFTAEGTTLGTVPLQDGVATLSVTTLTVGSHHIVGNFHGTGSFADSVSTGIPHLVSPGQTNTEIVANNPGASYGQAARFTVTMSVQAPAAGQPSGTVTVLAAGVPLGIAPVVNGTAIFETSALHAGAKSITATYSGDVNFAASAASAIQQNVRKAQTEVDARSRTIVAGESPLITVFVNITPGSSIVPSGSVSISENSVILGTQLLAGGAASFSLNLLAMGDHTLVVNYSGDADFEASSATIIQSVPAPAVSIHGARVLEGNRGVTIVSLVVSLSAPISQTARVSFSTVAGSATEGEDYEKASGVIEFAPGELTHAIELHIFGDTIPESDETFSVLLSDPVNATIDTPSAVVVIVNDDPIPPRRRPSGH